MNWREKRDGHFKRGRRTVLRTVSPESPDTAFRILIAFEAVWCNLELLACLNGGGQNQVPEVFHQVRGFRNWNIRLFEKGFEKCDFVHGKPVDFHLSGLATVEVLFKF